MDICTRLFEHNNWANAELMGFCNTLREDQLDAAPDPQSEWSVRRVLEHLAGAQAGYLALLTQPKEERQQVDLRFEELGASLEASGVGLLEYAQGESSQGGHLYSTDGYEIEPWVVLVQSINHASDHRRQVCGMLRALGEKPPALDGWRFAEARGGLRKL